MNNAKLISYTQSCVTENPDDLMAYCARVSNPDNQMNTATAPELIKYLIDNKHWSPMEMASMCVEIKTTRAIAAQILRHRSFSFQEFSMRYSEVKDIHHPELRTKGDTNRQGSLQPVEVPLQLLGNQSIDYSFKAYQIAIEDGVAPESARMLLPLATPTTLYMHGTMRSWIHYLDQRLDNHTQKEHRYIAQSIQSILKDIYPNLYKAVYNDS